MNTQYKEMVGYPKAPLKDYIYISLFIGTITYLVSFLFLQNNSITLSLFSIILSCFMIRAGWRELQVKFIRAKKEEVKLLKQSEGLTGDNPQGLTVALFSEIHFNEMKKVQVYNSSVVSTFQGPLSLPHGQIATKIVPMLGLKDSLNYYKEKYADAICISKV